MTEIRECPCCGKPGELSEAVGPKPPFAGYGWVGCRPCHLFIEYINGERGKRLAVVAWNRRACDDECYEQRRAIAMVLEERQRQDAQWGEQNHAPQFWVGIMGEEFGEYCQAVNETVFDNGPIERAKGGPDNMIRELVHVAAVAVSAIECLMRRE